MDFLPIFFLTGLGICFVTLFYLNKSSSKSKKTWIPKIKNMVSELDKNFDAQDIQKHKYALVEIDKLFDHVLIRRRIKGETMGERLKNISGYFDRNEYDRIWQSHKARNTLVHEVDITIPQQRLKDYYSTLRAAINQMAR